MNATLKRISTLVICFVMVFSIFAGTGVKVNAASQGSRNFVTRLYETILQREPDSSEVNYWVGLLDRGIPVADIVNFFFNSPEMNSRGLNNNDFVRVAYVSLLNREAESSGLNYWTNLLNRGYSRQDIVNGFLASNEFRTLCSSYGISTGSNPAPSSPAPSTPANTGNVTQFVNRLYQLVLERPADASGVQYWVRLMQRGESAASVTNFFFNSTEMMLRDLSNDAFLDVAYQALMNRAPDASGKAYWLNLLNRGVSRQDVINGFIDSAEFGRICSNYGVNRGDTSTLSGIVHNDVFVIRMYRDVLGREASASDKNYWISLMDRGTSASDVAVSFFESSEFRNRSISDSEFVSICYKALLGRILSTTEANNIASQIGVSRSRRQIILNILNSSEFESYCNYLRINRGVVPQSFMRLVTTESGSYVDTFVTSCYTILLNRTGSRSEIDYWKGLMNNGISVAEVVESFVYSSEYKNLHKSNTQFVNDMYLLITGSAPSSSARNSWVNRLNSNTSKYALINELCSSNNFRNLCQSYGINAGIVSLTNKGYWTTNNGARAFKDNEGHFVNCGWVYIDGYRYYFASNGTLVQNVDSIIGPQSEYYLTVNTTANVVTIYARSTPGGAFDTPVMAMVCSCGVASSPTIQGTFTLKPSGRWQPLMGNCWGQYCTQISGNYLFHSVWYHTQGDIRSITVSGFSQLGTNASHGCVRLTVSDAKWIYEHCVGSQVTVSTDLPQPFDKPATYPAVVVSGDYGYDPHDPGL